MLMVHSAILISISSQRSAAHCTRTTASLRTVLRRLGSAAQRVKRSTAASTLQYSIVD
jgi:hypothetical protein